MLLRAQGIPTADPLPTPNSADIGEIAVLEDDGGFFYLDKDGHRRVDLAAVGRAFYRTHGDDYQALALYLASGLDVWLGAPGALASSYVVRNAVQGIGLGTFDYGASFGSAARLEAMMNMNGLHRYPADPDQDIGGDTFSSMDVLLHELGHRWLAYARVDSGGSPSTVLLSQQDLFHWSLFLDSQASLMYGCEWATPSPDSFLSVGVSAAFSPLDQYLMGLRSKAETDSFFVVSEASDFYPPGTYVSYTPPRVGVGCRGIPTWWSVEDIEAVHGPRVPSAATSPRSFRVGMVLLVERGTAATAADIARLDTLRARLAPYFAAATGGRAAVDASLDSRRGQVCIDHEPLRDTESTGLRPIGARVRIAQAGIPIGLDLSSIGVFWRHAGESAFQGVPLLPAGPDSFAAALPGFPSGSTIEYYVNASSDWPGIFAYHPPIGSGLHRFVVGPDITPPAVTHVPELRQGKDLLPQPLLARVTDNLGVDSVWIEYSKNGGPLSAGPVQSVGRDSFLVFLGGVSLPGETLAYRFGARDRAAAGNVSWSNPAFDTLRVGPDWEVDFENGAERFYHQNYSFSYRDAWGLTAEESSPPGGTSWKCGAEQGIDYPPHLDSNLYSPPIADITPGTVLRFDHRFQLEEAGGGYAWDGARVEAQQGAGPWQVLTPASGYTHRVTGSGNPLGTATMCWSGSSNGWHTEVVDLSALVPGPARIRFRMGADEHVGGAGWFVDHVRIHFGGLPTGVAGPVVRTEVAAPWPSPTHGPLRLGLRLARAAQVEWSLHDAAGRRVAALWSGPAPPGGHELAGEAPGGLPSGLYFSRLVLDGRTAAAGRVVLLR